MANCCFCFLSFDGDENNITRVVELFKENSQASTIDGQLIVEDQNGWFFDIQVDEYLGIHYWCKWSPNIEQLKKIAVRDKVNFTVQYEEPGMRIYGKAEYRNGYFKEVSLDDNDLDLFEAVDKDYTQWKFRDNLYESDQEIIEILIEEKWNKQ